MDMDHLIGQRFNLISKSEIRYVGTLLEINPEQSTIALENVYSFGTEDRPVEKFIPPSQDKYGSIVFRGSDVKDIKIAEDEQPQHLPPQNMPDDPAILNASRHGPPQGPPRDGPFSPQGFPPYPQFGGHYPPGQFGRGYPPGPGGFGPGPGYPPYGPPPPGYFGGPPGHGFPAGPPGFHQQPPIGPPGQRMNIPQPPPQHQERRPPASAQTSELQGDNKAPSNTNTPAPPTSKPKPSQQPQPQPQSQQTLAQVAAKQPPPTGPALPQPKNVPTGPKNNRVTPAVPFTVNQKAFTPPVAAPAEAATNGASTTKPSRPPPSQSAMDEAARQAKEAVAAAMAKLNPQASQTQAPTPGFAAVDALSRKVSELSTSSSNAPQRGGRGNFRGTRGSYPRGGARQRMEIPKSDFDFESANAKFNKEDMIKEAIATGSPPVPGAEDHTSENVETDGIESTTPKRKDSLSVSAVPSYNKTSSFFDNISSEAKDREESQEARAQGRQFRGEEYKKNMETFGQGNVDSGFRGRGRGRGRGYGGGYGRGGYRARGRGGIAAPGQVAEQPQS